MGNALELQILQSAIKKPSVRYYLMPIRYKLDKSLMIIKFNYKK
jgi:hypothetical protein